MIPEKLGSKENPKRDIHVSPGKGKQKISPDKIESMGGEKRVWEGSRRGEGKGGEEHEGTGCSRRGRTERESKERDVLIEGVIKK